MSSNSFEIQPAPPAPTPTELEDFKNQVSLWLELEKSIEQMHVAARERVTAKNALSARILKFMSKYGIEDLNTKEGTLRYKVTQVKEPITQSKIKTKISENLALGIGDAAEFNRKIFEERTVHEKHSLKRVGRRTLDLSI
jgi:hypothetical protein